MHHILHKWASLETFSGITDSTPCVVDDDDDDNNDTKTDVTWSFLVAQFLKATNMEIAHGNRNGTVTVPIAVVNIGMKHGKIN